MHSILAARTDFSVGESILTTEQLVDQAAALGAKAVAITDTMSVTGMIDFTNRAKKKGIKPVIGCRLRLVDDPTWRLQKGQKKKDMPPEYFLTVYAMTEAGMQAIFRMLTLANSESHFYYTAKLGFSDLMKELKALDQDEDDLAVVLGDASSVLTHPRADDIVKEIAGCVGFIYAPLIPINTPYFGKLNELAMKHIEDGTVDPIVIRPALYGKDEADAHEIMSAVSANNKVSDPWHRSTFNRDFHLVGLADLVPEIKAAADHMIKRGVAGAGAMFKCGLENTDYLVNAIQYEWKKAPVSLPKMADDEFAAVVEECKKGWSERFGHGPIFGHEPSRIVLDETYMPRLKYELGVLKKLNFSGYFLLVQDVVRFAKDSGILVGPGRGSVGGSLVAYLMGITDCDPIRFGLMFERFINPDRIDLPDADLDFMSERRHEVIQYLIDKYGERRVAGVSNFGKLAAASAIRDIGRVTGIPEREYSISKMAPKLHGQPIPLPDCRAQVPEIDAFAAKHPAIWRIMERLEGTTRNFSQHAAGVVVGGCDLVERAVIERRKEGSVVCWDKRIVEDQGLVKMDILGLRTLDLIAATLDYIRERTGAAPDLMRIPLDDPKVLENFAAAKTTGVFQFESGGMRRLLKELGADGTITFADITAATALYRPGPMESGMMDSYYLRKQGNESVDYDHPLLEPILKETFGVIVYQEQVMKISQVIAGYSGAEADKLRKIMGKKLPDEMKKERDKFVQGCVKTIGCLDAWAGALFDKIEGFAGYGFNLSHSVEYTLISYQCMWLKTYHSVEFYAAALSLMDEDKLPGLIKDANKFGIEVSKPDINLSTNRFEIVTNAQLAMPFQRIKGISANTTNAILEARNGVPFASMNDFLARVNKTKCNVRMQAALDAVGAFARIEPGQPSADDPSRLRDQIELLPGLITESVPVGRDMHTDKLTKEAIAAIVDDYRATHGPGSAAVDGLPVKPHFGKKAKFMIISDAPGSEEEQIGSMGFSSSGSAVVRALMDNGLDRIDCYWTALIKRPKRDKQVTPEETAIYLPYLQAEIATLKPPVIVLLGSITVRTFLPDFKGKASEAAGKVIYHKDLDANLVVGFNPGEIYHSPEKQADMNEVFAAVATLLPT